MIPSFEQFSPPIAPPKKQVLAHNFDTRFNSTQDMLRCFCCRDSVTSYMYVSPKVVSTQIVELWLDIPDYEPLIYPVFPRGELPPFGFSGCLHVTTEKLGYRMYWKMQALYGDKKFLTVVSQTGIVRAGWETKEEKFVSPEQLPTIDPQLTTRI